MISKRVLFIAAALLVVSSTAMAATTVADYVSVNALDIPNVAAGDTLNLGVAGVVHTTTPASYGTIYGYVQNAYDFGAWDLGGIMSTAAFNDPSTYSVGIMTGDDYNGINGGDFMMGNPKVEGRYPGGSILATDTVLMSTYVGDTDFSGTTDFQDLLNFLPAYTGSGEGSWIGGDTDFNGTVDFQDLLNFLPNYTNSSLNPIVTAASGAAAVPEPSSIALLLSAIGIGLYVFARKRV